MTAPIARRINAGPRCFDCGGDLHPFAAASGPTFAVASDINVGDKLLVAATLEPVLVTHVAEDGATAVVNFVNDKSAATANGGVSANDEPEDDSFVYRREDLLVLGSAAAQVSPSSSLTSRTSPLTLHASQLLTTLTG